MSGRRHISWNANTRSDDRSGARSSDQKENRPHFLEVKRVTRAPGHYKKTDSVYDLIRPASKYL